MQTIPAQHGRSVRLSQHQRIRLHNASGTQVVDFFAFATATLDASLDPSPKRLEFLSIPHTRTSTLHLIPQPGDVLLSNLRRPMLTIIEDTWVTGGGTHDTLIAACNEMRYRALGVKFPDDPDPGEGHRSCATNLEEELCRYMGKTLEGRGSGIETPAPLNLFMHVPWALPSVPETTTWYGEEVRSGKLRIAAPIGPSGGYIELEAQMDLLVVMSACPNDMAETNGEERIYKDVDYEVFG